MSRSEEINLLFVGFQENVILPEPMLKAGGRRVEASEVIFGWFDEGGVKLFVVGIFVTVDDITIDKPADWCYICR